ncbi:MAG: rhodanese-like domain-containing protein [Gemmatimonadaceae bacterium]|nr:rhodanese-like domain-containing protein [Gemmatimonadaceae bacterium]
MPRFRNRPVDVVVDVRTKLEFWLGHLEGAVHIPVDTLAERLSEHPELTPDRRVMVYCASGARSAAAARVLKERGFSHVVDGGAMAVAHSEYAA